MDVRSEVLEWLEEAKADLRHADLSLSGGDYSLSERSDRGC
ncbi:MAG: hypothetical protein ACE5Z5_03765 [Candidatus Bathyarchaeia archaeon]